MKQTEFFTAKKMKQLFTSLFLVTISFLQGQNLYFINQHCYGTENEDEINCIAFGENNGYYLGITITEYDSAFENYHGANDIGIIKTDSTGNILWQKCYGGSNNESLTAIVKTNDSACYLVGHTSSADGDVHNNVWDEDNTWVLKINNSGDIVWETCIGGQGTETEKTALLTGDNGVLIMDNIQEGGGNISNYFGATDVWLCKINPDGNISWETTLGNELEEGGGNIIATRSGTYMFIGYSTDTGGMVTCAKDTSPVDADVWIVELDSSGNIISQNCYGGPRNDYGADILEYEGGFVFVATTQSDNLPGFHGNTDYWIVKLNESGNIAYQKCIGGTNREEAVAIFQRGDKGYMVVGNTYGNSGDVSGYHGPPGNDIFVAKTNNNCGFIEGACIGGDEYDLFDNKNQIIQKNDYYYRLFSGERKATGDIGCVFPTPNWWEHPVYGWLLNFKDCEGFEAPPPPGTVSGPDIFCINKDTTAYYEVDTVTGAWGYEWIVSPPEAAVYDTVNTNFINIKWNKDFEGTGVVFVRSYNECFPSQWSPMKTTEVENCSFIGQTEGTGPGLTVYPNPATNGVIFALSAPPPPGTTLTLYNIMGNPVATLPVKTLKTHWNTEFCKPGVYFYKLEGKNVLKRGKVIKK